MDDLVRLLPPIRRMRGNRLYAADGRRFLDLWLDDGRGMLGDGDRHARTFASNAADKGLTRPYPGLYDARFAKAVRAAWPGFAAVRLFSSDERALAAAARLLADASGPPGGGSPIGGPPIGGWPTIVDTAARPLPGPRPGEAPLGGAAKRAAGARIALARPFAAVPESYAFAMPRLPCPRPFSPSCLIARSEDLFGDEAGDLVPAQSLVASARGLAGLGTAVRDGYGETLWARFDRRLAAFFDRSGPYLFPKTGAGGHEAFFRAALEGGALVSPREDAPSVIPPDFDDGELVKLARALDKNQGS